MDKVSHGDNASALLLQEFQIDIGTTKKPKKTACFFFFPSSIEMASLPGIMILKEGGKVVIGWSRYHHADKGNQAKVNGWLHKKHKILSMKYAGGIGEYSTHSSG